MEFEQPFDATKDYSTHIPAGWYTCAITGCEVKESRSGNKGISLEFSVLEGEYKNSKVFKWVNYFHQKAQVRAMAQAELAALCRAAEITALSDTDQLLNCIIKADIGVENSDGQPRNVAKKFASSTEVVEETVSTGNTW